MRVPLNAAVAILLALSACSDGNDSHAGPLMGLSGDSSEVCIPSSGQRDWSEAFHSISVPKGSAATILSVELVNPSNAEEVASYLLPVGENNTNTMNVLDHFPPTERESEYVGSSWQRAVPTASHTLDGGTDYLLVVHFRTSGQDASFDALRVTYSSDGDTYTGESTLQVTLTSRASCF